MEASAGPGRSEPAPFRQYRLETSSLSRFVPLETQDLWLCACGEINRKGESCHRCEQTFDHCKKYLNVDLLRENKNLRLNGEDAAAKAEKVFGKIQAIEDGKRGAVITEAMPMSEFNKKCDELTAGGVNILSTIRMGDL